MNNKIIKKISISIMFISILILVYLYFKHFNTNITQIPILKNISGFSTGKKLTTENFAKTFMDCWFGNGKCSKDISFLCLFSVILGPITILLIFILRDIDYRIKCKKNGHKLGIGILLCVASCIVSFISFGIYTESHILTHSTEPIFIIILLYRNLVYLLIEIFGIFFPNDDRVPPPPPPSKCPYGGCM